jgi:hypothetical protein
MAYNLTGLLTEFYARGFDSLNDGGAGAVRATQWINDGYHALAEEASWPWLEATTTGTPPLTISDLRQVLYVVDTAQQMRLVAGDARDVVDVDPQVTSTGTPIMYWLDGLTTLRTYPVGSNTLSVRYIKVPADLVSGSDVPLVPERYRNLIVDLAVIRALEDKSNFAEAGALRQVTQLGVERMKDTLLDRGGDDPDYIVVTNYYEEGGV